MKHKHIGLFLIQLMLFCLYESSSLLLLLSSSEALSSYAFAIVISFSTHKHIFYTNTVFTTDTFAVAKYELENLQSR